MKLEGKRILITGGGSGMGLELARRLAGANEVVIAGRDETKLERAHAETPRLRTLRLDVTSEEDARVVIDWLSSELGGLDVLVNNAGVMHRGMLARSNGPDAEVDINFGGTVRMTRLSLPLLEASPEAAVIFMSSGLALGAVPGLAVYSATKAAVRSLARSLRAELAGTTVQIFEVLPPFVDTDLERGIDVPKMAPSKVVDAILAGVAKDRHEIAVREISPLRWVARLSPRLADRLVLRAVGGFERP
jgi:uncharacterized oxidoreductase